MGTHGSQKVYFLTVTLILAMPCGLVHAQSNPSNPPALICDQPSYDFGEMDNRKTVEHTFVIRNTGDRPVEITKLFSADGRSFMIRTSLFVNLRFN